MVWWRRPQPIALHDEVGDSAAREFSFGECLAGLSGLWGTLDVAWMNDPSRDEEANRKPYQLRAARRVGLTIPRTLITSDPAAAERFVREQGVSNVIYKAFTATERAWRETRRMREGELDLLRSVRFAPVIFQSLVEAELDVRVTVVGEKIFATAVRIARGDYRYDYRVGLHDAVVEAHSLPPPVVEKIRRLMDRLGLVYGALDFRRTARGDYVFLEVNPSGQWLFMEDRSAQPITEAVVDWLVAHDAAG
ncbi:MAG: alpha-L-glutamate ligase [Myxococcales bacterium]|nr:alpha-L-glutamate ligase [Myxococcales bacterium]